MSAQLQELQVIPANTSCRTHNGSFFQHSASTAVPGVIVKLARHAHLASGIVLGVDVYAFLRAALALMSHYAISRAHL
jgi:hypothetical protein